MFERLGAVELKQKEVEKEEVEKEEVEKEEVDNRPSLQDEWDLLILKITFFS